MKCFAHLSNDSVGICKNCHRGICTECLVDCGDGLACKGSCEERVYRLNSFLDASIHRKINSFLSIYIPIGILFVVMGAYFYLSFNEPFLGICFMLMGLAFGISALRHIKTYKKASSSKAG